MIKKKITLMFFIVLFLFMILFQCQCSIYSQKFKDGMEFYKQGNFDKSIEYFEQALKKNPGRREIRTMLFRSKLGSYYHHLAKARNHRNSDRKAEADKEYSLALKMFPNNLRLRDEYNTYMNKGKIKESVKFESTIKAPITLKLHGNEKIKMNLRNVPISKIFKSIGKSFKVNFIFDKDFRDFLYSIELDDIGFYQIVNQLCMVANLRYRVMDTSSILLYANTAMKKKNFDLKGVKVFYMGNIMAEDAKKLIMTVFRDQQIMIQEDVNLNALIVKASQDTLKDMELFIKKIDKERNEVEVDVEILEVNKSFLKKIGIDYGTTPLSISAGTVDKSEDEDSSTTSTTLNSTVNWTDLGNVNFMLTIPSVALNILETDSENKIIAKPNLRGIEGEEIKFMVGEELPVPNTQWQAIAAGGVENTPVTSYQYKNVGVDIRVTPYVHSNNDVTLRIKFSMTFVTTYVDSFPVLGKRELENVIRLKEGETNLIGGFIKDEIRGSLNGIPALSKIPVLGLLFGSNEKTIQQTDLIFSVTPRIIRKNIPGKRDLEPVWSNSRQENQSNPRGSITRPDTSRRRAEIARQNSVMISPVRRRIPLNSEAFFTIRLNSKIDISTLSIGGSVSGGNAVIDEVKTDFFKEDDVRMLRDFSSGSFDVGYSFFGKPVKNTILAQLKIRFLEKGDYTITIDDVAAYTKDKQQVELKTSSSEVQVY